jgi:SAM-dependent methyltransferase
MISAIAKLLRHWVMAFWWPRPLVGLLALPGYLADWRRFNAAAGAKPARVMDSHPCLTDRLAKTPFDPHYFYQGAWLMRRVGPTGCDFHVDIGSSVLSIGMLSGVCRTVFLDYRPLAVKLEGLTSLSGDILRLPIRSNAVSSLSCMHVVEHIGLGRYGDRLNVDGSAQAVRELERVLAIGGRLYLTVPVGRERVCFNAHRVFHPEYMTRALSGLQLLEFSYVDDAGRLIEYTETKAAAECEYGCGLYIFEKID